MLIITLFLKHHMLPFKVILNYIDRGSHTPHLYLVTKELYRGHNPLNMYNNKSFHYQVL